MSRYTVVRQNDQSDCGAAALATVALHYGLRLGVDQLRNLAGTDQNGTNLLGLVEAAERLGFLAQGVHASIDSLTEIPLPAIAHVTNDDATGHFVVIHRVGRDIIIVADPAQGLQKPSRDEFAQRWTGNLLTLVPDQNVSPSVRWTHDSAWQAFLKLILSNRSVLAESLVCAILMTLLGISTSYFIQHLVDSVLVQGESRLLDALAIGMLLIMLFRTLFALLRQYLLAHLGRKIDLSLMSGYSRHLMKLPLSFFEARRAGEILSRVHDASKVRTIVSGTTLTVITDGVLVVSCMSVLWLYDAPLALLSTVFVPLLIASALIHHSSVKRRSRDVMEQAAEFSAYLVEDVTGVETLKAFSLERSRSEDGEQRLVTVVQSLFSLQKLGMSISAVSMLVIGIAGILVLWYGGHRVIDGYLTIGQLLFFFTLLGYVLGPLERLAAANLSLQDGLVALDRLQQIMELETEAVDETSAAAFEGVRQAIEFRDLSFGYGCRENVLHSLNFHIPAGATVAIVGESGSGKSTLLKLLMRFYDPTEGRLLIDGLDVRDYDLRTLRSRIGIVSQDPFVFNATIRDNIAMGRPEAKNDEIVAAARAAGFDDFVATLPERYGTTVGERGTNLSGGQRQRLALARALLRQPDILLLDEATSHLDTATEQTIRDSIHGLASGKTIIVVAHRLSTVKDADIVYVLSQGRIVERGTHDELVRQQGTYNALWRAQTNGASTLDEPREIHGRTLAGKRTSHA